jgi:hypothetical protein
MLLSNWKLCRAIKTPAPLIDLPQNAGRSNFSFLQKTVEGFGRTDK